MSKKVRVNVRSRVNSDMIRRERRNGRDVIVVHSATLPDGVVMNGIRYTGEEIEKSYKSLNRTPAPLGHPSIEGAFVSASDPEGLARGWIGAWNENVRREKGRVFIDKVIDVEQATQLNGGKAVLEAIEKGEPIHTSTGLYCTLNECDESQDGAKFVASDIVFDHDAILLGETGAATPEQGVGLLVHASDKDGEKIEVINSALDKAVDDLDWAGMYLLDGLERVDKARRWDRFKARLLEFLGGEGGENSNNEGDEGMNEAQFKELSGTVNALSDTMKDIDKTIATAVGNAVSEAMKPLIDAQTAVANAEKAKIDAEKADLVAKVVNAKVLTEAVANTLSLDALRELAPKGQKSAAGLHNSNMPPANGDEQPGFKLPKAVK